MVDLNNVSFSLISSAVTLISAFAILRYQMKELKEKVKEHKTAVNARFKEVEDKHDVLKDTLIERIHHIDKNVEKILTKITNKAE